MSKSGSYTYSDASYATSSDDGKDNVPLVAPTNVKVKPIVWLFGVIGALGGLTFGFDIGGSGGTFVMPSFRQKFNWDDNCQYMKIDSVVEKGDLVQADTINYGFSWMDTAFTYNNIKYGFDTEPNGHRGGCQAWIKAHGYKLDANDEAPLDADGNIVFLSVEEAAIAVNMLQPYVPGTTSELDGVKDNTCWTCCCMNVTHEIPEDAAADFVPSLRADTESGWISFGETIGCLVGAVPSGLLNNHFGRRTMLFVAASVFCIGAIIQTASNSFVVMMVGRVIGGLGIGNLSAVVPVYQSEIAPVAIRGVFVTLWQFTIVTGILTAGLMNLGFQTVELGWRFSYGFNMFICAIMILGLFKCPESPRFLFDKKSEKAAYDALQRCRTTAAEVEWEINEMRLEKKAAIGQNSGFKLLLSKQNRNVYRLLSVAYLQLIQQFSGINAIMFFAPNIIGTIEKNPKNILYGNLGIQAVNFGATFITVYAVDRFGRRALMTSGSVICLIGLLCVGLMASPWGIENPRTLDPITKEFPKYPFETNRGLGVGVILMCCVYIVGFAYSWGPVVWIDQAEFFSNSTRAIGAGVGTVVNWGCASIVAKSFPLMQAKDGMGLHGSFFFFAGCLFTGAIYCFMVHPETNGVPLEEMDEMWNQLKVGCGSKKYITKAQRAH